MTGKDLIIYILKNGLENETLIEPGHIIKILDEHGMAANLGVGPECIKTWATLGTLHGFEQANKLYFINKVKE